MDTYAEVLLDFYSGEVAGEAGYSALVGSAQDADERFKLAALLQLETETKAWLRAPMLAHGVSLEEHLRDRVKGIEDAAPYQGLSWRGQMQTLHDAIALEYIPRYQGYADDARDRGDPEQEAVCRHMVDHEKAQVEFARRELQGASLTESLQPIVALLRYPIPGRVS